MSAAPSAFGPRWSRWLGRFLAKVYWRVKVVGKENIPAKGAVIVVANHVGLPDGPVIHGVLPRPSHFLVKASMMRGPLGALLGAAGQITVDGSGRQALSMGLAVLKRGSIVGIFPEGTRGAGHADQTLGGAAWLAVNSGALVVPTAIIGSRLEGERVGLWPRPGRRMFVSFGEPLHIELPEGATGRERQALAGEILASALRAHVKSAAAVTDLRLPAHAAGVLVDGS